MIDQQFLVAWVIVGFLNFIVIVFVGAIIWLWVTSRRKNEGVSLLTLVLLTGGVALISALILIVDGIMLGVVNFVP